MRPLSRSLLLLGTLLTSAPALAQRQPVPAPPSPPASSPSLEVTPTQPSTPPRGTSGATGSTTVSPSERAQTTCEQVRRKARFGVYFDKVEIEKLIQTVADATCRTFILPENVRGRISIIGPENGRVEVTAEQFYSAFLAALDANNLAVYQYGKFMKIVEKPRAKQNPIPMLGPDDPYPLNEQMVTKIFKVKFVEVEQLRAVLQNLVSQGGDTIPFPPDTLIINDVGANLHRLEQLIDQLDQRSSSDEVRVIQIQHAGAQEIADKIQKLFEQRAAASGGARPGGARPSGVPTPPGAAAAAASGSDGGGGTLSQIIPDERTNKLIVVASPSAFERIDELIRVLDIPSDGGGRINIYYLENANAEELASTLQSLAQGQPTARPGGARPPPGLPGGPGASPGATSAELFQGEVKISADKATNSLVIIASQSDYKNLVNVIAKLDVPRPQVFVEAVIMEVNLTRSSDMGLNLHSGYTLPSPVGGGRTGGLVGTNTAGQGLPPSLSLSSLAQFGGFLAGLQGPLVPELSKYGIDIPAFGIVLHALQTSADTNVLSTPHILTSDNEEAEITVGENVPFQSGFSPANLGGALGGAAGVAGAAGGTGQIASLAAGLGGLGSLFAPITRQNVELKLTVKPQINESEYIRMVINEQTEEIVREDAVLGPTTAKRSAKTTVVVKDQETVVIGGIMQDRVSKTVRSVPILGELPLLGRLFRTTEQTKRKTNLLLFLTPYIIRDGSDFRRIFERKLKERQQFVEQFYGQVAGYDVPVDFRRKSGPLAAMSLQISRQASKAENGGTGAQGERVIQPNALTPAPRLSTPPAGDQPDDSTPAAPPTETPVGEAPEPADGLEPTPPVPEPAPQESPERLDVQP